MAVIYCVDWLDIVDGDSDDDDGNDDDGCDRCGNIDGRFGVGNGNSWRCMATTSCLIL